MSWFFWAWLLLLAGLIPTAYAGVIGAPFVPTRRKLLERAFAELKIGPEDTVVDLGAGDGTVLLAAAQRGAKATGYELSPFMWLFAALRTLGTKGVRVRYGNFYRHSIGNATIVFAFLMPKNMERLRHYLLQQDLSKVRYIATYIFPFQHAAPLRRVHDKNLGTIYIYDVAQLTGDDEAGTPSE